MRTLVALIALVLPLAGQAPTPPVAVVPAIPAAAGQFSVVAAVGAPTTTPRHASAALGLAESVSATQEFFLTILMGPPAGGGAEQTGILLGMTQSLGTVTFAGLQMHSWASAAFGTALSNISKVNLTNTPAAVVTAASTNAAFTTEYVVGFGYQPAWCARCELGPVAKYIHVTGEPSQAVIGMYLQWRPK